MSITSFVALQLSCLVAAGSGPDRLQPVTPNPSVEARKVLSYLKSIQGQQTLAGHHVMYGRTKERDLE